MTTRVAINGFGRIGRAVLRSAIEREAELDFVAVNDVADADALAHLLTLDSVYDELPCRGSEGAARDGRNPARADDHQRRVRPPRGRRRARRDTRLERRADRLGRHRQVALLRDPRRPAHHGRRRQPTSRSSPGTTTNGVTRPASSTLPSGCSPPCPRRPERRHGPAPSLGRVDPLAHRPRGGPAPHRGSPYEAPSRQAPRLNAVRDRAPATLIRI